MATTTHVYVIFDESGSMHGKEREVAQGFNAYIADLKAKGGEYRISATKFDTAFRPIFKDVTLADVPEMTTVADGGKASDPTTYQPRGMTALFDAVGKSLQTLPSLSGDDNALCVIFTDGQENSSREWTASKISTLLKDLEATGKWAFIYIGEDQSRWAAEQMAAAMGINRQSVTSTATAQRGSTMAALSHTTQAYNAGTVGAQGVGQATQAGYDDATQGTASTRPSPPAPDPVATPARDDGDPWGNP